MGKLIVPLTDNWARLNRYSEQHTKIDVMDIAKDPMQGGSLTGLTRISRPSAPSGTIVKSAKLVFDLISSPNVEGYFEVDQLNGGNLSGDDGFFNSLSVADYYQRLITPSTPLGEQELNISGALLNSFGFVGLQYRVRQRNDGPGASTINITIKPKHIEVVYEYIPRVPANLIPNGGESVFGQTNITWTSPSEVTAPSNELHYEVQFSANNGQTWSNIGTTSVGVTSLTYDFSSVAETSLAKVRVRAVHGTTAGAWLTSVGVFSIKRDISPYAPINLSPAGILVDRSLVQRLSWKHNDPNPNDFQSKAEVQYRKQGVLTWTTNTVFGANNELFIASNTFPAGQVEWRVRTYDQGGLVSPYSTISVFTSSEPTIAPVIIRPTSVVSVPRPVIEWTGGAQQSYQVIIEDSLNVVVWDTGEVVSTIKARTVDVDLINGATYKIKVRIQDGSGLFSSFAEKSVQISFTPPPTPVVSIYEADGFIAFNIEAASPSGAQPPVESYEIYKRINDVWARVAYGVGSSFNDYHVKSGVTYEYYVKAIGTNGTTANSETVAQSTTFRGSWIHTLQDAEASLQYFRYNGTGYETYYEPESAVMKFAGRTRPVVHFGNYEEFTLTVRIQSVEGMSDMDVLRSFVRDRETVCYRDADGNLIVGHILALSVEKEYRVSSATITIVESDFNEGV